MHLVCYVLICFSTVQSRVANKSLGCEAANASSVLNNERRKSHCSCSRAGCELCDRMPGCACAETEKSLPLLGQKCNMTKLSSVQSMTYYAPSRNAFIVRLYTTYMYTCISIYIYVHILYISVCICVYYVHITIAELPYYDYIICSLGRSPTQ